MTARVLIVEDDPTLRAVIRLVLERAGYGVDEAEHGTAALVAMSGSVPDVAVVDLRMPIMDGLELIDRMRGDARMSGVRVVLLSGFGESVPGGQAADAVLAKPFEPERLIECVRALASTPR